MQKTIFEIISQSVQIVIVGFLVAGFIILLTFLVHL